MPLPPTYFLADVDGVLCVACRSTDYEVARYFVVHWPTRTATRDFCLHFEVEADKLRELVKIVPDSPGYPGLFHVVEVRGTRLGPFGYIGYGDRATRLELVKGGQTQSILLTHEAVPVPRVGKGTSLSWEGGRWHIRPPKGKHRVVEV